MGAVELVFLTAPKCELLDPDEVLERLEWLDPSEAIDDASLVVFPELFAVWAGFFSVVGKYFFIVAFPLFFFLWGRPLPLLPVSFVMVELIFCLYLI